MARLQVGGIEAPQLQTVSMGSVRANTTSPTAGKANQLVEALRSGQQLIGSVQGLMEKKADADNAEADAYYNSKTLAEIGQEIKEGKLPASASPVFRARVENLYGSNYLAQTERTVREKITNGELATDADVEKYLTTSRNEFLSGASKYTVAGFDKSYGTLKQSMMGIAREQQNAANMENAVGSASENLINIVSGSEVKDEFGVTSTPLEAVDTIVDTYKKDATYLNMPPAARKSLLANIAQDFITRGDATALQYFLDKELDNGLTIGTVLTGSNGSKRRQMTSMAREQEDRKNSKMAETYHDKFMQQAETSDLNIQEFTAARARFEPYKDFGSILRMNNAMRDKMETDAIKRERAISFNQAQASFASANDTNVRTLLATGEYETIPDLVTTNQHGTQVTLKTEDATKDAIERLTQGNPMARFTAYSRTGYEDETTKQELMQTAGAITSAGLPNSEVLPETITTGLDTFRRYNAINPAYTKELMGDQQYERLQQADTLINVAKFDPRDAAQMIYALGQLESGADPSTSKQKVASQIEAKISDYVNGGLIDSAITSMFGSPAEKALAQGERSYLDSAFGGDPTNMRYIRNDVASLAKMLQLSGRAPDAASAIKMSFNTLVKNGAFIQANGKYYRSVDAPTRLPEGVTPSQALGDFRAGLHTLITGTFKEAVDVEQIALEPKGNGVMSVLIYPKDGSAPYTLRDPRTKRSMEYRISDIEKDAKKRFDAKSRKLVEEGNLAKKGSKATQFTENFGAVVR